MCATAGKDGRAAAVEFRSVKKKGVGSGWMHIHLAGCISDNGDLLATRVSVPASLGRMHIHSSRGISDNGALVSDEG
jgi:hypothetical protein